MNQNDNQHINQEPQSSPTSMEQSEANTKNVPLADTIKPEQEQEAAQGKTATANTENESASVKKQGRLREMINNPWPWMLLTAPLFAGCIWLMNHSWLITNNLNKPYALLAGPALVASILLGWLVVTFFKTIASWCVRGWNAFQRARKEDSSAQFFWIVIVVFMVVSVFASGNFFTTIEHNAFPGLGYATALFIDLVAVQAMRARLNAVRMRNTSLARLYLSGVLLCAGASAFANVYTSLANFNQQVTGQLPLWMLDIAPWFGLVFPVMILLLSITADATIDQISTRLDPEAYRERQAKQTKMLEYQRDALREQLFYEQEIETLSGQLHKRKEHRVFFLYNWMFPIRHKQNSDTHKVVEETLNEMRPWFQFLDQKCGQAIVALQTIQKQYIQESQKKIAATDADMQLLISEFLIFKQMIEQKENIFLSSFEDKQAASEVKQPDDEVRQNHIQLPALETHDEEGLHYNPEDTQFQQESPETSMPFEEDSDIHQEQHTEELHIPVGAISEIMVTSQKNHEGEHSTREIAHSPSKKTSAYGPRTMEIAEVAEKFGTTIAVVKEAIKNNQLKLSKRGENKILTSSLKDFTPPRKRARRPTKKLVEAEAVS